MDGWMGEEESRVLFCLLIVIYVFCFVIVFNGG